MKRILLTSLLVVAIMPAIAQVQFEAGVSLTAPDGGVFERYDFGKGYVIEPRYAFNRRIEAGIRFERITFFHHSISFPDKVDRGQMSSLLGTFTYKLLEDHKDAPYFTFRTGPFFFREVVFDESAPPARLEDKKYSRVGFELKFGSYWGIMNYGMSYAIVGDDRFFKFIDLTFRINNRR